MGSTVLFLWYGSFLGFLVPYIANFGSLLPIYLFAIMLLLYLYTE